ncbi:MAG: CpsD/CapB family tyrosine-protein kinase [Syntrophobacterales bacterium]|nr:CpsD/CapB family tyrosine-protein kinase [Syntrophobacterales bacterium]
MRGKKTTIPEYSPRLPVMTHMFDQFYRVIINLPGFKAKESHVLLISAANIGEGASTISLNLVYSYAHDSAKRALLIDGNLRNPSLHAHFGVPREKGLTDMVEEGLNIEEIMLKINLEETDVSVHGRPTAPSFHFLPAGRPVPNPTIFFQSQAFQTRLDELRRIFPFIIIDGSPLVRYPESSLLASRTDGVILVIEHESTSWEVAGIAKKYLQMTGTNIIGAILNRKHFFIPEQIYKYL